jgi:hypothetical protein
MTQSLTVQIIFNIADNGQRSGAKFVRKDTPRLKVRRALLSGKKFRTHASVVLT